MTEMRRYPVVLETTNPQQTDWFPVDAAKTLSHQDLLGLKLQELGGFWMLRLFCWKDGSVPASPKRLAVLCRSTEKQMERLLERLDHLLEPHPVRPDRLIMPLVEEDRPEGLKRTWDEPSIVPAPEVVRRAQADTSVPVKDDAPAPVEAAGVPVDADGQTEAATSVEASMPVDPPAQLETNPPAQLDVSDAKAGAVAQAEVEERAAGPAEDRAPQTPPKDGTNEDPSEPEAGPAKKMMSFFMEQESVFDAHDMALCTLSEVRGEPEKFKPERHYRMKASRRRIVAAAIQSAGLDVVRQAARNLPLSLHLSETLYQGLHPLDIERACLDAVLLAELFDGADAELAEAIREAPAYPRLENLDTVFSPWQPPPPPEPSAHRLF